MSRRPGSARSHSNEGSKYKKVKTDDIPPFSTTEYIHNIQIGDKFVSIIGYVDSIQHNKIKSKFVPNTTKPDLELYKFTLNNNDGTRVSCYSWGDEALRLLESKKIEPNHIILLQNVIAKPSSSYNAGNVDFELQLKHYSKTNSLGMFQIPIEIKRCNFSEIPLKTGIIKIKGYVKDEFFQPTKNRPHEYIGTITDGEFKIEIVLCNVTSLNPISAGRPVQVIGDVQKNDFHFFLQVNTPKNLKILDDPPMPLHKLLAVYKMFSISSEPS